MFSRPRVQPEGNYGYENYNNTTTVVPLDFVRPHHYTTFRTCFDKKGRKPSNEYMERDQFGNDVDDWITVIVNPNDYNDNDFAFSGTTDASVRQEVQEEIEHYRSLLRGSFSGNVRDYITEKFLSTYDIRLKIYQLLAIKYHIIYNPIQEARAEILRPAEPASASINGGKRKKMKGGGALCSRCIEDEPMENIPIYDTEGNFIASPDENIYIKTEWQVNPRNMPRGVLSNYTDNVRVYLSNSRDYNWKLTPVNGNIDSEIQRLIDYYDILLHRMGSMHAIAFDDTNNTIVSKWNVMIKMYELYAVKDYFDSLENFAIAQRIGGKRRKKTKKKLKKNKSLKKRKSNKNKLKK